MMGCASLQMTIIAVVIVRRRHIIIVGYSQSYIEVNVVVKRAVVILVSIIMVLGLAGCRDQQEGARDHTGDREVAQEEQKNAIQVDEGIVHVEITIPATLVATDDADIDDLIEEAREKGVKEIVRNNDGTLTFKMTKAQHGKMMWEM